MTTFKIDLRYRIAVLSMLIASLTVLLSSCNKEGYLDEKQLSSLNADVTLTSKVGFNSYLIGLIWAAREEYTMGDNTYCATEFPGTDSFGDAGAEYTTYQNWATYLNPVRAEVVANWNWAYQKMIPQANTIIVYANKPELQTIWDNEAERNAVIAEARFFRAYAYNTLANLYGGVPIIDTIYASPKFDFVRATRKEVYEFAKADLEFASKWLPATVAKANEGHIVKAAADHLLSEVYINLGEYEKSVESASRVINSGLYQIMNNRFGTEKDKPGDAFSDLFRDGNQNRSSGNLETIYVVQIEEFTAGGSGTNTGNNMIRNCAPFLINILDPDSKPMVVTDSMGRGVGRVRGSNYLLYNIWKDNWNDMRNSQYNMRRVFYYNNPASPKYFGKIVEPRISNEDTMRRMYPYSRKIEGKPFMNDKTTGKTSKDIIVYRLAGTYLLRAEAYMRKGDLMNAAKDLNVIRTRANAKPVNDAEVTIDYILDERARELMLEEPRRQTLMRMGKLVERVRKYDLVIGSRNTVQDYNNLWPIPQEVIDANSGAKLEQNPGYN